MNGKWMKLCSILLVLCMIFNMLPIVSNAAEPVAEERIVTPDLLQPVQVEPVLEAEEITANRTKYTKEFRLNNGLYMAVVYPDAVHYETADGWEEIDNTLVARDGVYKNTAGVWEVALPQKLTKGANVTITKDGYTLSFHMAGQLRSSSDLMTASTAQLGKEMHSVSAAGEAVAVPQQIDLSEMREGLAVEEMLPEKAYSRLQYEKVFADTNIIYDLDSNKVKESIVLGKYDSTLQGYRYNLNTGGMIPVLEDGGQILLYDSKQENVVMVMPAPYLMDANNRYNGEIQVQLTGSGSNYTLTYLLPQQWLSAEDRAWPVILDPIVTADLSPNNIKDRTVAERVTYGYDWGINEVGYDVNYGKEQFYMKYQALPTLTSSDVVVGASIQMYKPYNSADPAPIEVHKVLGTWDSTTITWANKPGYNTNIEDYAIVQGSQWYGWNITDIVREWYSGQNTGMMFKASDAVENGGTANWKQFYSSDWGNYKPILSIMFRNNNGLESYWDYTAASAGRAGTGYVNTYTGNLTWVRADTGFGGNRMPVSIQHVYNLNDAIIPSDSNNSNDSGGNSFGMGIGWRTNFNQLLYRWNIDSAYYVWEDADGTDHYFLTDSNGAYKDEDGLELTLTDNGSGTEKYCITDKYGNKSYFDERGRLSKLSNNQQTPSYITITYVDGTSNRIDMVTDGVGRVYNYCYDGILLSRISYQGTGTTEKHYVSFAYDGIQLTRIGDGGGPLSIYTYNSSGLLESVQDSEGYKLTYSYQTPAETYQPYRVHQVTESDGPHLGGTLTFAYGHNVTSIMDHNTNKQILQFNDMGNLVSIQDDEGHAQYAQYAKNIHDGAGKSNQLTLSSKLQNTVSNHMWDMSFEGYFTWDNTVGMSNTTVASPVYSGLSALQISGSGSYVSKFSVTIEHGETYTFSGYAKSTAGSSIYLALQDTSSVTYTSSTLSGETGWERLQATYTNNSGFAMTVTACAYVSGTAYLDCVQLEEMPTASRYNIIDNGDFRYGIHGWTTVDGFAVTTDTPAAPQLDSNVYTVTGNPTATKRSYQYIQCQGEKDDTLVLSGWAKGNGVPLSGNREFGLKVILDYTDGTRGEAIAHFNPDTDVWQYSAVHITAEKPFRMVIIEIIYDYNANTVSFDGIQLFKEEFGSSYKYDDNGNVKEMKDLQGQITKYFYDNNNLERTLLPTGAELNYKYDSYHNVIEATTEEGVVYTFEYDDYGNNTSVSVSGTNGNITGTADYTDDGNRLESTRDAAGKTTTYQYHPDTNVLEWVQYPEDTPATRTNYTYDNLYRMASATVSTDAGNHLGVAYTYTGELLTGIQTPTTTYGFSYGAFDLRTGVSIGSYDLATYSYTDYQNRYLESLDYGNDDSVQYTYDNKGRVTRQTYEDGDIISYAYDNSGALATVTDSATGIKTTYYYDFTDRLMKYVESGTDYHHSVSYEYDNINNLTAMVETINGVTKTTEYTYDQDNRISAETNNGTTVEYIYDSYGRVAQQVTKAGDTTVLTKSYTYNAAGQVTAFRTQVLGYDVTYSYTYDDNGNILSVHDGTYTTSYVYDSQGQLLRENNQAGGFTHTWTYDNAGNILERKEYAYTTGSLEGVTPTDTVLYGYGDAIWGDLLTSYDGSYITYDEIGNPLSDGTCTYTWEHGRQLKSLSKAGYEWTYTYDANGMRTTKSDSGRTYSYVYNGDLLMEMTVSMFTLRFTYDAAGTPLTVTIDDVTYYYVTNVQGDVVAILNEWGGMMGKYAYDSWGACTAFTGSVIETLNPLLYRGYVYDWDTGLYYLQSRYYDPETGRFLNADAFVSTGQGMIGNNMFAYCNNNPILLVDNKGTRPVVGSNPFDPKEDGYGDSFDYMNALAHSVGSPFWGNATSPVNSSDCQDTPTWGEFGAGRSGGRTHMGVDVYPVDGIASLYGKGGTPANVYAMLDGVVVDYMPNFYANTSAIVIRHGDYYVLYGEISTELTVGDIVSQGQVIGKMKLSTENTLMLHLEIFYNGYGGYARVNPYRINPTYATALPDWRS